MNETLKEFQNRMKKELRQNAQAAEGLEKWALAGRLALLGEPDLWENCEINLDEVAAYFKDCAQKWDDLSGQELADAIIRVQDLLLLEKEDPTLFTEILDYAEGTILDADAEAILEEYLVFWPIPEEKRLNVVDAPISDLTLALLKTLRPEKRKVEAHWNETKRSWETPGTQIQWTLRNREKFMFSALPSEGIRSMRIGVLPVCRKEESDMWETLPHSNPTVFEKFGLTVDLHDGRQLTVPIAEHKPSVLTEMRKSPADSIQWLRNCRPEARIYDSVRFWNDWKGSAKARLAAASDEDTKCIRIFWRTDEWKIFGVSTEKEFRFAPDSKICESIKKIHFCGNELTDKVNDYWKVPRETFDLWCNENQNVLILEVFLQGEEGPLYLIGEEDNEE